MQEKNDRCVKAHRTFPFHSQHEVIRHSTQRERPQQPVVKVTQAALRDPGPIAYCLAASGRRRHALRAAARSPSGDGNLRSSVLSFVGGDHPDRHPPHSAPSDHRSPPRLPRDFSHGLPGRPELLRRALVMRPTENGGWDADLCTSPYPLCALVRNSLQ